MQNLLALKNILLAAVFYTVLITIALLFPTNGLPSQGIPHVDKVVHFFINAILVFIWLFYAFLRKRDHLKRLTIVLTIISCFTYGILIEVCQEIFTTTRQADLMDIIANSTGLLAGYLAFSFVKRKIF
ncbi:VanZ family protein [Patiriisocius marinistellae]|uniref:VanZ family protein n=1 Tax=Patiriisocius marinistellae TaxID=2494560 RepID=UPI00125E21B5|nr:VanZ family protein [Patiriisocius marinistellae]